MEEETPRIKWHLRIRDIIIFIFLALGLEATFRIDNINLTANQTFAKYTLILIICMLVLFITHAVNFTLFNNLRAVLKEKGESKISATSTLANAVVDSVVMIFSTTTWAIIYQIYAGTENPIDRSLSKTLYMAIGISLFVAYVRYCTVRLDKDKKVSDNDKLHN